MNAVLEYDNDHRQWVTRVSSGGGGYSGQVLAAQVMNTNTWKVVELTECLRATRAGGVVRSYWAYREMPCACSACVARGSRG